MFPNPCQAGELVSFVYRANLRVNSIPPVVWLGVFVYPSSYYFGAAMRTDLRLSIPSKGRLAEETVEFLQSCGIDIYKPNPRQYEATIPSIPGLTVLFQRPTDIVISVRNGSVDFG